jgi:hypothetical protein
VIGVGVVAGVALSAVNLYHTMKLREDVKQLRLEVKNGFIDLKKALKDQGTEIIQRIDEVAQDIKFEQHRLVLIQAYGRFLEATKLMKIAMLCEDASIRNGDLANARQMLADETKLTSRICILHQPAICDRRLQNFSPCQFTQSLKLSRC